MNIDFRVLHDLEAVQHPQEHEVEFAVCEERASAHAVSEAVGEEWGVGLFEPALGAEIFGVAPDVGICDELATDVSQMWV